MNLSKHILNIKTEVQFIYIQIDKFDNTSIIIISDVVLVSYVCFSEPPWKIKECLL